MEKDFDGWNKLKKQLDARRSLVYFHEREVWWCNVGANVGVEINGKGKDFERPVLILKKFNKYAFIGIPLTTSLKQRTYYFPIGIVRKRSAQAVISQMRLFSCFRLTNKVDMLSGKMFVSIKKALIKINIR